MKKVAFLLFILGVAVCCKQRMERSEASSGNGVLGADVVQAMRDAKVGEEIDISKTCTFIQGYEKDATGALITTLAIPDKGEQTPLKTPIANLGLSREAEMVLARRFAKQGATDKDVRVEFAPLKLRKTQTGFLLTAMHATNCLLLFKDIREDKDNGAPLPSKTKYVQDMFFDFDKGFITIGRMDGTANKSTHKIDQSKAAAFANAVESLFTMRAVEFKFVNEMLTQVELK